MTTDLSQTLELIGIITLACMLLSPILAWVLTPKLLK